MRNDDEAWAARRLAERAATHLRRAPGPPLWRTVLHRLTRGRLGGSTAWAPVPDLGTPWQDTISPERLGWRQRAAYLHDDIVFAVDYQVCHRCRLGWVENPYTEPMYQRCGLASAGLSALRAEHPYLEWHTLGSHLPESKAFWRAAGTNVAGEYRQLPLCSHVDTG